MQYQNPILSGFNPDPSICRVNDDYYLVTSTFEFFPGVPIYHSKNLINWELVGHCLTSDEQLYLHNARPSAGIYAATIRYHDGTFFMTTTNLSHQWNFIVHAKEVKGPWSAPAWVKQQGIDPSLFWDDDGSCYFVSNGSGSPEEAIYLCQIDPFTGEKLSPSTIISHGCGGKNPEGPHIYKKNGWYYLMLAEGGTALGHMETISRAKDIFGPYEPCPRNPILTHRDLLDSDPRTAIQATGHGDLVEDQNGNWWMVHLGIRYRQRFDLGRETFLAPVIWDEAGWPIVGEGGCNNIVMDAPLPGPTPTPVCRDFSDEFDGNALSPHWNFLRNPVKDNYLLEDSRIFLKGTEKTLSSERSNPTAILIRQPAHHVEATACLVGEIELGQRAGLTAFYNELAHYEIFLTKKEDGYYIGLGKQVCDIQVVTECHKIDYSGRIGLKLDTTDCAWYTFCYETDGNWLPLGRGMTKPLTTRSVPATAFTGVMIGLFSENGTAAFDSFSMRCLGENC
ncbi:MAG: glycoside hydrolase family 43 protein [Ruminococcaceae bacterium]|nr:glycoside hydrolase family 43 protein [Oscillospiraceae bacterium]